MKKLFLSLCVLGIAFASNAQSADDIIAKHIEAIGGADLLSKVQSMVITSDNEVMGNAASGTTTVVTGKGVKNESDFNGQHMVQVITENGGWAINPFTGSSSPEVMPESQYKVSAEQIWSPDVLYKYADHEARVELQGKEKVGDVDAYKLKYNGKSGAEITFYLDPNSYHIIRTTQQASMMGQDVTMVTDFSDYKKSDFGVTMPYTTNTDFGQFAVVRHITDVKFNKEVDSNFFDMPK